MRVVRRLVHALVVVLTLLIGAAAAAVIVSQTAWFKNWLREYVVRSANEYLNGTLTIERLGGNLFFGIEMENVAVSMDGERLVAIKDLGLGYDIFQLISRGLSIDTIRLNQPVIYLRRGGDAWSLSRLIKKQRVEADRRGPAKPIAIDEIGISGGSVILEDDPSGDARAVPVGTSGSRSLVRTPKRFEHLDAKLSFKYEPVRYSIEITHLSFRASEPPLALNALSGGVAVKDDEIFLDKISVRTAETSMSIAGAIRNYLSKPVFNLQISSDKLSVAEVAALVPALGTVRLQPRFEVALDGPADRLGVEMNVQSSAGEAWTKLVADLEAPGQSVVGDVSVKHLDLAPILDDPKRRTDITGDAKVDLRGDSLADVKTLRGTATVNAKRVMAAGYDAGPADAKLRVQGRRVDVTARGRAYGAIATASGHVMLSDRPAFDLHGEASRLDLRRLPRHLNVPAAETDVNAEYHVSGTASDLSADTRFRPSTVAGAAIDDGATGAVTLHGDEVDVSVDAGIRDLDLQRIGEAFNVASLATERYRSRINGHIAASVRGVNTRRFDPATVDGTVTAAVEPSTVGQLDIAKASMDADAHHGMADVRSLNVVSRDVNVDASGTLALDEAGQSNLKVHADSSKLESIGSLFDLPMTGIGQVDATVTGTRRELRAAGTLVADGFKYKTHGALAASSSFTAIVPDLDISGANVSATTHATFVTIAGQDINEVDAQTEYARKQLDFDATARQPQRSLAATGSLLLHPDHQEVHLGKLALQSQNVRWQTPADASATIRYRENSVDVRGLRLANGDQQIAADGTFGTPGDALHVTLRNVDVATVDALLLREPQLTGRLDATATVTGNPDAPAVDAQFAIANGGFHQFRYNRFGGTAKYAADGVELDARLDQNPTTWATAKGYAPLSADAPRSQYALHVLSSPIDLGIIQGFTTQVKNVTGTVQADVAITGTAGDPRPNGNVTVQNGALLVPATGVAYMNIDGRIALEPDKVHIEGIHVLDNRRQPLTISGDLAIHEREVGGLAIAITSNDFKVIDNNMGNVRVNSNVKIAGQLNAPRIEGDLGLSTGRLNLDPILAALGESAYATEATTLTPKASAASSSPFDPLYAYVRLTVPNDLVVKASDLKTPGAPIGFGALTVTLGGDLTVHKAPWDQPRVYGVVNTVRGTYDFQGRRFDILRDGTVRFEGTDELNPALDVRTQRVIQAVTANVTVRGRLQQPEIALSSVPPLEEADILSLVVFNQPINQIGEGAQISLAQRAQGMALGAAAGQLAQSIGSAIGLDAFELNLAPEAGGSAQVTVGEQVGQNLFLKVQQSIGDQSQTNFILEYELTNWLRFRTNVLQGTPTQALLFQRMQGSGADLLFFFGF